MPPVLSYYDKPWFSFHTLAFTFFFPCPANNYSFSWILLSFHYRLLSITWKPVLKSGYLPYWRERNIIFKASFKALSMEGPPSMLKKRNWQPEKWIKWLQNIALSIYKHKPSGGPEWEKTSLFKSEGECLL